MLIARFLKKVILFLTSRYMILGLEDVKYIGGYFEAYMDLYSSGFAFPFVRHSEAWCFDN